MCPSAPVLRSTSAEKTYGLVIGSEQAAKGTTVDLGPTINIVRGPALGAGVRVSRRD
jgi:beta-glucosidase